MSEHSIQDAMKRTAASRGVRVSLAIAVLVFVSSAFAVEPLWDAVTAAPLPFAVRTLPLAYLVAAPLFGVWDTLSLLALSQHYAVLVTLMAFYVAARLKAPRGTRSRLGTAGFEVVRAGLSLVGLLAFYAVALLVARPMTGIELSGPDLLAVDFHSHTSHSHDGRGSFSAAKNRAWHESGGFDVAYVTDHSTWQGVDDAAHDNPPSAGEGTVLLSGAEIRIHRQRTNILGDRDRYLFALDSARTYMDADSIAAGYERGGRRPTLLFTMPGALSSLVPFTDETPSGMVGIELNDASPRGLEQVRFERREIIALADSLDLALLAAADLHGWGRTVASWGVMSIAGWQGMTPEQLGDAIEQSLHDQRRDAVVVVERRMPYHDGSGVKLALTLPWVVWEHFRMLSWSERFSWLLWLTVVGSVSLVRAYLFRASLEAEGAFRGCTS